MFRTIQYYILSSELGFQCIWITYKIYNYGQLALLIVLAGLLSVIGVVETAFRKLIRFLRFCYKVCCVIYVMNRQMKISFRTLYSTLYDRQEIRRAIYYMSRDFMNPKKKEKSITPNYQVADTSAYVYHKNASNEERLTCPVCLESLNITKQFQERYFKKTLYNINRTSMKKHKSGTLSDKDSCLTPCGHCFHFGCLRTWYQQKQECPQCRNQVAIVDCKIVCKPNTGNKKEKIYMMRDLERISS